MHKILLCLALDLGYLKYWNLEAFCDNKDKFVNWKKGAI